MTKKQYQNLKDGQLLVVTLLGKKQIHIYNKNKTMLFLTSDNRIFYYSYIISLKDIRVATQEDYDRFIQDEVERFEKLIARYEEAYEKNENKPSSLSHYKVQVETYKEAVKK